MTDLIHRLRNKEEEALRELMAAYGTHFLRLAFLLLHDRYEAEEIVQDMFVAVYSNIFQLKEDTKLKSWMTSIIINQCRKRKRKWSVRHIFLRTKEEEGIEQAKEESTEETFVALEDAANLTNLIKQLDYKYREVITLFYYEEFSIGEIGRVLELNENTVKSRLLRGRVLLKERLERERNEG